MSANITHPKALVGQIPYCPILYNQSTSKWEPAQIQNTQRHCSRTDTNPSATMGLIRFHAPFCLICALQIDVVLNDDLPKCKCLTNLEGKLAASNYAERLFGLYYPLVVSTLSIIISVISILLR